jgi:hypothetical protein
MPAVCTCTNMQITENRGLFWRWTCTDCGAHLDVLKVPGETRETGVVNHDPDIVRKGIDMYDPDTSAVFYNPVEQS